MDVQREHPGPDLESWCEEFQREAPPGAAREYERESAELIAIADDVRRLVSRVAKLRAAAGRRQPNDALPVLPEIIGEQLQEVLTPSAGRLLAAALESASSTS